MGTHSCAEKLHLESCFLPITETQINNVYEVLIFLSMYKSDNEPIREFYNRILNFPQAWGLENFNHMSRNQIDFIYSNKDIGKTKKVKHAKNQEKQALDLEKKLFSIVPYLNQRNLGINERDFEKLLAVDESLRGTSSHSCPIKNYMPLKPDKFREKTFFCYRLLYQLPKQFSESDGTIVNLTSKMTPDPFLNRGLIADNDFISYQKKSVSLLGSARSLRIQSQFENFTFL